MDPDLHRQRRMVALATRQHRNVTRRQLLDLGLGPAAIKHRIRTERLHPVHPGVYAVGCPAATALERAAAAVLACGPGAALSHGSALCLWGLGKHWRARMDVTVPGDRRHPDINVHRCPKLAQRDFRRHQGIGVTSPARTLLDCAPALSQSALARAVNDARLAGLVRPAQLADVIERFPLHPGTRRLAPLLDVPGGPTRSQFEDAFLEFCRRYRLPSPRVNVRIAGHEADALFEAERLIVELDGYRYHADRGSFERDRDRDADSLAAGFGTVRITWERMRDGPEREARRLQAILATRRA